MVVDNTQKTSNAIFSTTTKVKKKKKILRQMNFKPH